MMEVAWGLGKKSRMTKPSQEKGDSMDTVKGVPGSIKMFGKLPSVVVLEHEASHLLEVQRCWSRGGPRILSLHSYRECCKNPALGPWLLFILKPCIYNCQVGPHLPAYL